MEDKSVSEYLLMCVLLSDLYLMHASGNSISPSSISEDHQLATSMSLATFTDVETMTPLTTVPLMTSFHSSSSTPSDSVTGTILNTVSIEYIKINSMPTTVLSTALMISLSYPSTNFSSDSSATSHSDIGFVNEPTTDGSFTMSIQAHNALTTGYVSGMSSHVLLTSSFPIFSTHAIDSSTIEDDVTVSTTRLYPSSVIDGEFSTSIVALPSSSTPLTSTTTGNTTEANEGYPNEFKRPMLLLGVGLSCGLGGTLILFIILHGYQRSSRIDAFTISKANSQSGETLETCTITPLGSDVMDGPPESVVDMNGAETISIQIHPPTPPPLPPPPPPPPPHPPPLPPKISTETEDPEDHDYFVLEPQKEAPVINITENFTNKRWSYHEGLDMPMKTFKGSTRVKPKRQTWGMDGTVPRYLSKDKSGSMKENLI